MEEMIEIYCKDRAEWRKWLKGNGSFEKGVWLIYYKKHTGKPRVPYDDAVEEAICFGWIDSTIRRINDDKFKQKFTPRKRGSNWSEHNIRRANKMIAKGKMTKAGLIKYEEWKASNKKPLSGATGAKYLNPPAALLKALKQSKQAMDNFDNLAPSHKKNYIRWILDAKKEETRIRRIDKAVKLLEKNAKSFM